MDASITWVSEATTAAGLYVGATRGRYANVLHVVAADPAAARDCLVAAMGRDRADRGLDTARTRAQTHAHPANTPGQALPAGWEQAVVPAGWRSMAELDAAEAEVEARYNQQMRALRDVAVTPDDNKRTAWASLVIFLDLNGAHWDPDPPDIDDSEATMMAIAAGKVDEAWVADWLRHRVAFSGPPAADVSG